MIQSSVLGVLSLGCLSCTPGRAVEQAAGPMGLESRLRPCLRVSQHQSLGVAEDQEQGEVRPRSRQGAGLRLAPHAIPGEKEPLHLPPASDAARAGGCCGWLSPPCPGTEKGTDAHVPCLARQGRAAELDPRPP